MTSHKIINGIVGIIIAVVLSMLLTLGIKVFYAEPQSPYLNYFPPSILNSPCASNDQQCITAQQKAQQDQYEKERQMSQDYNNALQAYNRNIFIIANIAGIVLFLAGMGLLSIYEKVGLNVIAGILASGGFGIFYGYVRGWNGTDDKLKFVIGVVIAAMVIASAILINNKVRKAKLAQQDSMAQKGE